MSFVISIDPGRIKSGLILVDLNLGIVIDAQVVIDKNVIPIIEKWKHKNQIEIIYLGNGTSSNYWRSKLNNIARIEVLEEYGTTILARDRYWELSPPGWLIKWIPRKLLIPSQPLDAIAALVLLERHLDITLGWEAKMNFKI